ncbi:hypothetical protein D6C79_10176 [Aureobasidium pullulans]|nr:hypothetical protein D6C79_10176 [Aureobasidium pullulans]
MSSKRPSEGSPEGTPGKLTKSENGDFSRSVRKKLTTTSRTGQACDRCKVRKIRCDARPGGCSPCIANNLECKTTDRITGRATSRGHTEHIEGENMALKQHINDLRQQLIDAGQDPRPAPIMPLGFNGSGGQPAYAWPHQMFDLSSILGADTHLDPSKARARTAALPDYRNNSLGDNYLGISGANEWLSPIKGTSVALFGMELDLVDFVTNDNDEAFSPTSYENFLSIAFKSSQDRPPPPSFPSYRECKALCEWYFVSVNCHAPIVHKPDVLEMVDRLNSDEVYQPDISETVQLHMIIAMMLFQSSVRNSRPTQWADHYRYAASFLPDLMAKRTLPNIQAIALICLHLRNFTKPGAAWFMSTLTLNLCAEMGLHRSVSAWGKTNPEVSEHEIEMRKRVFWSVLVIHTSISNKLGRPLAMRLEDFDVEFPKALDDNTGTEASCIDEWHKCSYRVACHNFKQVLLVIQVQTSIYSVRAPPHSYELTIQKLERDLDYFLKSIPIELSGGPETAQDDRACSLYLQFGAQELNLLVHHPAVCRTQNTDVNNKNLDVCLDASAKLLHIAQSMRALKALDTTWLNATVWLSAMFVTLFAYNQRKDHITSVDLNALKDTMEQWLSIIGDIGHLMGSGAKLQNAVRHIVNASIDNIHRHLAAKTASAAVASANIARSSPALIDGQHDGVNGYNAPAGYAPAYVPADPNGVPPSDTAAGASYLGPDDALQAQQPYQTNGFAYPDPSGGSAPAYPAFVDSSAYTNGDDIKSDLTAQLAAHNAGHALHQNPHAHNQNVPQQMAPHDQTTQNLFQAFTSPSPNNSYASPTTTATTAAALTPQQQPQQMMTGPVAWRHFTHDMLGIMGTGYPGFDVQNANALLALGQKPPGVDAAGVMPVDASGGPLPLIGEGLWPLTTYGPVSSSAGY